MMPRLSRCRVRGSLVEISSVPYLTGNTPGGGDTCHPLFIPDDLFFRAAVRGALYELTDPAIWEQFGTLSPDDCAALAMEMIDQFNTDVCASGGDMELIVDVAMGSDAGYLEFTSIPQTYAALQIHTELQSNGTVAYDGVVLTFNGDTGANYRQGSTRLTHSNFAHQDNAVRNGTALLLARTISTTAGNVLDYTPLQINIHDYNSTTRRKHLYAIGQGVADDTAAADYVSVIGMGSWKNSSNGISTIRFAPSGGTLLKAGSRVRIYGLKGG